MYIYDIKLIYIIHKCLYVASSPVGGFETQANEFIEKIKTAGCKLQTACGPDHVLPKPAAGASEQSENFLANIYSTVSKWLSDDTN